MAKKITRISTGSKMEQAAAYSRATVIDDWVFVSGCTGMDYDTGVLADGVEAQCEQTMRNVVHALHEAGSHLDEVVRVTYILPDRADFEPCWPILRRYFGEAPPAATMIEAGLVHPEMKIEIEVTALITGKHNKTLY